MGKGYADCFGRKKYNEQRRRMPIRKVSMRKKFDERERKHSNPLVLWSRCKKS